MQLPRVGFQVDHTVRCEQLRIVGEEDRRGEPFLGPVFTELRVAFENLTALPIRLIQTSISNCSLPVKVASVISVEIVMFFFSKVT